MSQSWKQIVDQVAGPEKDPVVYDFPGRKFVERESHGAYMTRAFSDYTNMDLYVEPEEYMIYFIGES